jgi:hypothetical protein
MTPLHAGKRRGTRAELILIPRLTESYGLDDVALPVVLGCTPDVLTGLRLCRRLGAA